MKMLLFFDLDWTAATGNWSPISSFVIFLEINICSLLNTFRILPHKKRLSSPIHHYQDYNALRYQNLIVEFL